MFSWMSRLLPTIGMAMSRVCSVPTSVIIFAQARCPPAELTGAGARIAPPPRSEALGSALYFHLPGCCLFLPIPHMHALGWSSEPEVLGITVQTKFLAAVMEVLGVSPGAAETEWAAWQGTGWPQEELQVMRTSPPSNATTKLCGEKVPAHLSLATRAWVSDENSAPACSPAQRE